MKKVTEENLVSILGEGKYCDIVSGGLGGWALGATLVGAATGGTALALAAVVAAVYCSSNNSL